MVCQRAKSRGDILPLTEDSSSPLRSITSIIRDKPQSCLFKQRSRCHDGLGVHLDKWPDAVHRCPAIMPFNYTGRSAHIPVRPGRHWDPSLGKCNRAHTSFTTGYYILDNDASRVRRHFLSDKKKKKTVLKSWFILWAVLWGGGIWGGRRKLEWISENFRKRRETHGEAWGACCRERARIQPPKRYPVTVV